MATLSTTISTHGLSIEVPAIVFSIITILLVATRFWSRLMLSSSVGSDDWVILTSLVSQQCQIRWAVMLKLQCFCVAQNGILIAGKTVTLVYGWDV